MSDDIAYRFPVPSPLTPEAVLHVARRLAEAAQEGRDITRAVVDGRFYVVPVKGTGTKVSTNGPSRTERADGYRADILRVLREQGPLTAQQIGRRAHLTSGQTGYLLGTLIDREQVEKIGTTRGARYQLLASQGGTDEC